MSKAGAIFAEAFRSLKPQAAPPAVQVEFRPFANASSSVRLRDGRMLVRLSDLLRDAPEAVLAALARILISKLYRQPVAPADYAFYRRFLNQRHVRRRLGRIRRARGRKLLDTPRGQVYDLRRVFRQLNRRYFGGRLPMPVLSWSRARSRTVLGHFDAAHNTVVISRLLDSPRVPRYVLEYLLYHEMLHLKYPVEVAAATGDRRRYHSRAFRQDERRFAHYAQARRALKRLVSYPG